MYGRLPFEHAQLEGLSNLSEGTKLEILSKERLAQLGREYGLDRVIRWKPRKVTSSPPFSKRTVADATP